MSVLTIQTTPEQKQLIEQAAAFQNCSVDDFILDHLLKDVHLVLTQSEGKKVVEDRRNARNPQVKALIRQVSENEKPCTKQDFVETLQEIATYFE